MAIFGCMVLILVGIVVFITGCLLAYATYLLGQRFVDALISSCITMAGMFLVYFGIVHLPLKLVVL